MPEVRITANAIETQPFEPKESEVMIRQATIVVAVLTVSLTVGRPRHVGAAEPSAAPSAELSSSSVNSTNQMPAVVVTATRIPSETETTTRSVTVLQGEELDQKQVRTVAEALRAVPGLNIARAGQVGGQTAVFMRGAESDHTLVLVDGVRANNGFDSLFDFGNMPMDNIERIEILRGPQSTLYGSEAIGGVINIVTKRGAEKPTGTVTMEGGSYNTIHPRASFAGTYGKLSLAAAGSYFSTDNDRINSDVRQRDVNGNVRYQLAERLSLTVSGWVRDAQTGSPGADAGFGANDPFAYFDEQNGNIAATVEAQPMEIWDVRVVYNHNNVRRFFHDPNELQGGDTQLEVDRDQVDFQNVITLSDEHVVVAGVTYDVTGTDRRGFDFFMNPTHITPKTESYAGYLNYEFNPMEALTLTAGGRIESFETYDEELTGHAGARYTLEATGMILRANIGNGFRSPNHVDLYYPGYNNPTLSPERSIGWDAGIEQPLWENKARFGVTYFQNEFDDLITYNPAINAPDNIAKAQTIGIESFAAVTPVKDLTLRASYTFLPVAEDRISDTRLLRRPRHNGEISADYRFLERFDSFVRLLLVGDRDDYDPATFEVVNGGAYAKLDIGLSCDVCTNFTVFGRIENVTDEEYAEVLGYPALGRTLVAGGTIKF